MSLSTLFEIPSTALIWTAPPGFGKTSFLLEMIPVSKKKIIFLSPLRAICEEFSDRVRKDLPDFFCETSDAFFKKKKALLISTPERLFDKIWIRIEENLEQYLFVLDEVHLFIQWGYNFRPHLLEVFMRIVAQEISLLMLSATIEKEYFSFIKEGLFLNFENIYYLNHGNMIIKNKPTETIVYPHFLKKLLYKKIIKDIKNTHQNRILIFCSKRNEVYFWERIAKHYKKNVWTCVGGEAFCFYARLKESSPDIIVATTVLSHGVNLPSLDRLYFTYDETNPSFYIQMVARGGRRGEGFKVFILGKVNFKNIYKSYLDYFVG